MSEFLIQPSSERKKKALEFADSVANYLESHNHWDALTNRHAIIDAVMIMTEDIGLAQRFLDVVGVGVDLYDDSIPQKVTDEQSKDLYLSHDEQVRTEAANLAVKVLGEHSIKISRIFTLADYFSHYITTGKSHPDLLDPPD